MGGKVPPYRPYVATTALATIKSTYPAASYSGKFSYATDLGIYGGEVYSDGKNWVPVNSERFAPLPQALTSAASDAPTITDLATSTSSITSAQRITKDDPCFTYMGNNLGIWASNSNYIIPQNASNTADASNYMSVTFMTDSPAFELYLNRFNTRAMVFVDDQPALSTAIALDTAGSTNLVKVDFSGVRKVRTIRVSGYNMPFGGLYIGQYDSVFPVLDFRPLVCVMGDSYTQGTGANAQDFTFAGTLCRLLGVRYWLDGIGGAGYASTGTSQMDTRQQNRINLLCTRRGGNNTTAIPDCVIWAMGYNDAAGGKSQAQIEAGIDLGYASATYKPDIFLGSATPLGGNAAQTDATTYIAGKAESYGKRFISLAGIITSVNRNVYTLVDNVHPSQIGHDYLGYCIARKIRFAES